MKNKKNSGFTLIELLVVSTIIVVLAMVGIVSFSNAAKGARDGKRKSDVETLRQAFTLYRQQNASYPVSASFTDSVINTVKGTYVSDPFPVDPKAGYSYSYNSNGSAFCICAQMEATGKGNSSSGATGPTCPGLSGGTTYYCAKSL